MDAYWLGASNPLSNGIEKLPLLVSQWFPPDPPVLPKWSNLVKFDFQQNTPPRKAPSDKFNVPIYLFKPKWPV